MKIIQSSDNKFIKQIKSLKQKKYRTQYNLFFDEGIKNIELSLKSNYKIKYAVIREDFDDELLNKIKEKISEEDIFVVSEKIFASLSDTMNSQGIIAVYEKSSATYHDNPSKVLVLDTLQDPGNIGTIIRTADAFGINTIYYTKGTADIFSPKVVRSSMGSIYFTSFYEFEDISELKNQGYKIYATCLEDSISIKYAFTDEKIALVLGNEANGVSREILDNSDKKIRIDMKGNAQSLNVAIASAIAIYEITK